MVCMEMDPGMETIIDTGIEADKGHGMESRKE